MRITWDKLWVHYPECWETRQPQDYVKGRKDRQVVPIARPDEITTLLATTLAADALKGAFSIEVVSASSIEENDSIGITFNDDSTAQWVFVSDITGTTLAISDALFQSVDSGNAVSLSEVTGNTFPEPISPSDL